MCLRKIYAPTGVMSAMQPTTIHMISECRGPVSGQNVSNSQPESAPAASFPPKYGNIDKAMYDASWPRGAIAAEYSYKRGDHNASPMDRNTMKMKVEI